jgi:predicted MFS family arabinose efflux permease
VVKIAAWIFLLFGVVGGIGISLGFVPAEPRWRGLVILAVFFFFFCFLYIIAKIADLLIKIINEIKKE